MGSGSPSDGVDQGEAVAPTDDTVAATQGGQGFAGRRPLARGREVGRYIILSRLGAGGMGVVYAAYDPELDRKVALKLLHQQAAGSRSASGGHARLLREAQAMAKISHPHVVAVHDVGEHDGRVFLAMEFVAGETLAQWIGSRGPTWRDVVAAYVAAGRGLAAAHAKGLVHRDFKPENVMIGRDGRVQVMDFGLARTHRQDTDDEPEPIDELVALGRRSNHDASQPLTRRGAVIGTPAYMAPEQWMGGDTDARTDQFSFCVALWRGVYGAAPFEGDNVPSLAVSVSTGKLRDPGRSKVPGWLRRVLSRGLQSDPQARFTSMDELLAELGSGQARRRRRVILAVATPIVLVAAAAAGAVSYSGTQARVACERAGESIWAVWDEAARSELTAGLEASGAAHATVTAQKVIGLLDDHAARWTEARAATCRDATIDRVWAPELQQRSVWCLDERRVELQALVAELSRDVTRSAASNAIPAAVGLRRIEPCRDADLLTQLPSPPSDRLEELTSVRSELSRARAMLATGDYARGLELAQRCLADAEGLQWPPLTAAARQTVAELLDKNGRYNAAEAASEQAYFEAIRAGAIEQASDAATDLIDTVGYRLARVDEGIRWSKHAEAVLDQLPDPTRLRRADISSNLAAVYTKAARYPEAVQLMEDALEIKEVALGAEHPQVASILNNLGGVRWAMGDVPAAKRLHERALAIRQATLGPRHPMVAATLNNLGIVSASEHDADRSIEYRERALSIQEGALGPDHPKVALTLNNLAVALVNAGDLDEAKALHRRALAVREAALGARHPDVAVTLGNLAVAHYSAGEYDEAIALLQRALSIQEEVFGGEHPDVALSLNNLGSMFEKAGDYAQATIALQRALAIRIKVLGREDPAIGQTLTNLANVARKRERYAEAQTLYLRALAIREASQGKDHPDVAYPLLGLARNALARKQAPQAVRYAQRALAVPNQPPGRVARAQFELARALVESNTDRDRALALARQALATFRAVGDEALKAEVTRWLKKHGSG